MFKLRAPPKHRIQVTAPVGAVVLVQPALRVTRITPDEPRKRHAAVR